MNASNIVFNNAIEDPWQWAGMREIKDPALQPNLKANMIDCENCAHCIDIHKPLETDAQSLVDARKNTQDQISQWMGWSTEEKEEKDTFM